MTAASASASGVGFERGGVEAGGVGATIEVEPPEADVGPSESALGQRAGAVGRGVVDEEHPLVPGEGILEQLLYERVQLEVELGSIDERGRRLARGLRHVLGSIALEHGVDEGGLAALTSRCLDRVAGRIAVEAREIDVARRIRRPTRRGPVLAPVLTRRDGRRRRPDG